jgi:hypothetical protein
VLSSLMHLQLLEFLSLWSELHRGVLQLQNLEMSQLPPPFVCHPTGHRSVRQIRHPETLEPGKRVEIPRHCGAAEVQELEVQIRQGAEVPMDPGAVEP